MTIASTANAMITISATLQATITLALAEAVGQIAGRRGEQI